MQDLQVPCGFLEQHAEARRDTLMHPKWQWHLNFTPKAEMLQKVSLQVWNFLGELPAEFLFTV